MRLLFVPGVANAPDAPLSERLRPVLARSFSEAELHLARWDSTGRFFGDAGRLTLDSLRREMSPHSFRGRNLAAVTEALRAFGEAGPGVVVGHSFGAVLAIAALRELAAAGEAPPPCVLIGAPFSHPVLGRWLDALQLAAPPPGARLTAIWNQDDPITRSRLLGVRHPPWCRARRISVLAGRWENEHAAEHYLGHPVTVDAIRKVAQ